MRRCAIILAILLIGLAAAAADPIIATDDDGKRYLLSGDGSWIRIPAVDDQTAADRMAIALAKFMIDNKARRPYTPGDGGYTVRWPAGKTVVTAALVHVGSSGVALVHPMIFVNGESITIGVAHMMRGELPELDKGLKNIEVLEADVRALAAKVYDQPKPQAASEN